MTNLTRSPGSYLAAIAFVLSAGTASAADAVAKSAFSSAAVPAGFFRATAQ